MAYYKTFFVDDNIFYVWIKQTIYNVFCEVVNLVDGGIGESFVLSQVLHVAVPEVPRGFLVCAELLEPWLASVLAVENLMSLNGCGIVGQQLCLECVLVDIGEKHT